jgi:hypothetical protein
MDSGRRLERRRPISTPTESRTRVFGLRMLRTTRVGGIHLRIRRPFPGPAWDAAVPRVNVSRGWQNSLEPFSRPLALIPAGRSSGLSHPAIARQRPS